MAAMAARGRAILRLALRQHGVVSLAQLRAATVRSLLEG
ncbi:MAG: hypothetical protein QOH58_507 [Thermoleophilaceae bacterium]|jgi:hypothetical protein|nr:hypothetical protein [Thermoleophilaceae bacterium]